MCYSVPIAHIVLLRLNLRKVVLKVVWMAFIESAYGVRVVIQYIVDGCGTLLGSAKSESDHVNPSQKRTSCDSPA